MAFLLTSNNKFGICDTTAEGHDIITNMSGNGAFVMYVKTGDMIYTILSGNSFTTDAPVTTYTTTSHATTDTTTSITSTTSTSIYETRYHYNIYTVYNDNTTLIYNSENNSGRTFTSIDGALENAYTYLSELNYNGTYDYFIVNIIWEKHDGQNVIETGNGGSYIYPTTDNSTDTTTEVVTTSTSTNHSTDTTTSPASTMTTTNHSTDTTTEVVTTSTSTNHSTDTTTSPASTMTTTNHSTDTTTEVVTTSTSTNHSTDTTSPATTLTSTDTTTSPATTLTSTLDPFMVICNNCGHEYSRYTLNSNDGCPRCGDWQYTNK